jgi:hypothetical protein
VRLAPIDDGHTWSGLVRCEASAHLPLDTVRTIADRAAALLPLVASQAHLDPRAPQNLVPIGALERDLRHRMGDPGLVYRALRAAVAGAEGVVSDDQVGRVLGSEHTSTATFRVVVDDDQFLQLDDLVVVRTEVPKMGEVRTYGVVTEAEAIYEGARYESDTHRIAELGIMPAQKVRSATIAVTRVDPEVWVSADPGEPVERATGDERSRALYTDQMERPLPVGLGRDGAPVHVDLDFFDGRKGGHMSIAGISGVATKTSFALFFPPGPDRLARRRRRRRGQPPGARVQRQGRRPAVAR